MVAPGFGVERNRRALMAEGGAFASLGELFNAAYDQPTLLHLNPFTDNRSLIGLQTATSEADERVLRSIRTPFEREARNTDLITGLGYDEERQAEVRQRAVDEGLMVSPEQLTKEFADIDLKFDRPMTREAANMLALSKRQQLRRDAVFSASSGSIASYGAMFAGGFAAAAIDPIEFGTAFIPVFGAGRRLMLAQKIGRVPTAMVAGAVDGGIGGAVLEPAYFGLSSAAQLDYTMYDALFNVGVGAAFGATLGGVIDGVRAARGRQDPNAAIVLDDRIAPGTGDRRRRDYYTAEEQDAAIASIAQAVQGHAFDASLYDPRGLKLERKARADLALRTARELAAAYRGDGGRAVDGGLGEALTQLAGPRAATADQAGLARAQKMAADGADRDAIFRETGWFDTGLGWRYQLDPERVRWRDAGDVDAMLRPGFLRRNFGSMRTLGEILDAPELFKAYPRLAKLPVTFREARETGGGYVQYIRPEIEISAPDAGEALRALRHEVQHAIQHTEGDLGPPTRTGGFYSAVVSYFRRPDEAEARIAERAERGGGSAPALEVSPELQNKAEADLTFDDFQALVRAYIDDRVRQGLLPEEAAQAAKLDVEMMRREWETGRRGFALANGLAQRGDVAQRYTDAEIDQIARETEVLVTSFLEAVFMRYGITVERLRERFPEFLRVERIQELGVEGAAEAIVEQAGDPPSRAPAGDLKGIFQRDTGRIGLTEAADASTAVHEVFHGFIDALIRMAERDDAPDLLKRDLADGVLEAARQVGADGVTWRDLGSVGTVAQMIGPRAQGAAGDPNQPVGFYSRALQAVEAEPMRAGTAQQWANRFSRAGVRREELTELGWPEFTKGREDKIPRDEVRDFIAMNTPRLELKGAKNNRYKNFSIRSAGGLINENYVEILVRGGDFSDYKSPHFASDEIMHIRMADHYGSAMLIELQSDLHQKGRRYGYARKYTVREEELREKGLEAFRQQQELSGWGDASIEELEKFVPMPQYSRHKIFLAYKSRGLSDTFINFNSYFKRMKRDYYEQIKIFADEWQRVASEDYKKTILEDIRAMAGRRVENKFRRAIPALNRARQARYEKYVAASKRYQAIADEFRALTGDGLAVRRDKPPRAPFEVSWMRLGLRVALQEAVKRGSSSLILPTARQISAAVGGDPITKFYDRALPNYAKKYAKEIGGKVVRRRIIEPNQGASAELNFEIIITPEARAHIERGQALYQGRRGSDDPARDVLELMARGG
ncbi:MAG: LPD23 domain-containing protein, partial [Pseudomonadota bacterium]